MMKARFPYQWPLVVAGATALVSVGLFAGVQVVGSPEVLAGRVEAAPPGQTGAGVGPGASVSSSRVVLVGASVPAVGSAVAPRPAVVARDSRASFSPVVNEGRVATPEVAASAPVHQARPVARIFPRLRAAVMPAVMAEPAPALALSPAQAEAWNKLQDDFVEAVGGPDQDPEDEKYLQRWHRAQLDSDDRFRAMFGQDLFYEHQREVVPLVMTQQRPAYGLRTP